MTSPETVVAGSSRSEFGLEWLEENSRWVTIASIAVIVLVGGVWLYRANEKNKEVLAAKDLFLAKQSMGAGNPALAHSDLQKLVTRFEGTSAGSEGAMLLAQMDYDQAKYQEGITLLERSAKSAPKAISSAMRALLADGYLSMKNAGGAAKEYEAAAAATDRVGEKAANRAKAARAYTVAGDTAKARAIWADLINDGKNQSIAGEARIRLAELTAKPAK